MANYHQSAIMFKTFAFLFITVTVAYANEAMDPEYTAALTSCKPKFPSVHDDVVKEMCQAGFSTTNEDVKCLIKCVGESMQKITADGKIIKDATLAKPPPMMDLAKLKGSIDACAEEKGSTDCDTAYVQWQCIVKAAKIQ